MTAAAPLAVFAALGDPTRVRLLELLSGSPQSSAAALAGPVEVSRQAVEKHLRVLGQAGLVRAVRHGHRVSYAVDTTTLEQTAGWLQEVASAWGLRLVAVKEAAERAEALDAGLG